MSESRRSTPRFLRAGPAAALLALGLAACGGGGGGGGGGPVPYTPPPPPAPLEQQARLYYSDRGSDIADSVRIVVRSEAELADVWTRATSRQSNPPAPPSVDWASRMVVVVGAGRMTTEDRIRVDRVGIRPETDAEGRSREVLIIVVRTIRGCGRSTLDAYPLEIVTVPRHDEVRFEGAIERDPNCGSDPTRFPPT